MNDDMTNGLQPCSVIDDTTLEPITQGTSAERSTAGQIPAWRTFRGFVAGVAVFGCQLMLWQASADSGVAADESKTTLAVPLPAYRVETDEFAASEADIRAVLDSAGRELWRFFPDYKIEPIVVTRGRQGPMTLYQRNDRGEIVIRLDTEKTYWSQSELA